MSFLLDVVGSSLSGGYVTNVAASVFLGLGYYLLKGKTKVVEIKTESSGIIENIKKANTIEECNEIITKEKYTATIIELLAVFQAKALTPNTITYNGLLLNGYYNKEFDSTKQLLNDLMTGKIDIILNLETLNIVIRGLSIYYKNLLLNTPPVNKDELLSEFDNELNKIFIMFKDKDISPEITSHKIVLDTLGDQGRFHDVWIYFQTVRDIMEYDTETFLIVLKCIRSIPKIEESWIKITFNIYEQAKKKLLITEEIYYVLMEILLKYGDVTVCENFFKEIEANLEKLKENTYIMIIKAYIKSQNIEKADLLFNNLKEKLKADNNSLPSTITYASLMNTCIKSRNSSKAEMLFLEMSELNVPKNAYIYSIMIKGYRKLKNYSKAFALYEEITNQWQKNENIDFNDKDSMIVIINSILDCSIICGEFKKMEEIYLNIKIFNLKYPDLKADVITYSTLIKGFAKTNETAKVWDIYNQICGSDDIVIDEILFNTILDSFSRSKDEESVDKIYNDMIKRNAKIGIVTYGTLIKLYVNINNEEKAKNIYNDLILRGIKPTIIIYQLMIKLYSKNNKPQEAIEIFNEIYKQNIKPDYYIYDSIIRICLAGHLLKEAFHYVMEGLNEDVILSKSTYELVAERFLFGVEPECIYFLENFYNFYSQKNQHFEKKLNFQINKKLGRDKDCCSQNSQSTSINEVELEIDLESEQGYKSIKRYSNLEHDNRSNYSNIQRRHQNSENDSRSTFSRFSKNSKFTKNTKSYNYYSKHLNDDRYESSYNFNN